MTEQLSTLALQNASLLRAIKAGPAASPAELAQRADIVVNNLHRKLDSLEEEGLIVRDPAAPKHEATLTAAAETALKILSIRMVPANRIRRWPANPRSEQTIRPEDVEAMGRSIGDKGVLQPLTGRPVADDPDYDVEVVIGERRRRGCMLAVERGWQKPDFLVPVDVRELSDEEAEEIAGVENIQREDMHWMDEARWFLRLSARLSGSAIERLIGGQRGKRSIQDYIKCARELAPGDVAKTYLPDGDKDQLTYVKARDLVGEKKERPALDLSPKLAVALLETIATGLMQTTGSLAMPALGATVVTRFARAFAGGPLATLSNDRKLIAFGFEAGQMVARTKVTEDLARWLAQLAFDSDPHGALWRARAAVIGELHTNVMEREGRCLTDELNAPAPPPATMMIQGEDGSDQEVEAEPFDDGTPPQAAPAPAKLAELPPMLAIVVVEAAHKISALGMERGPGTWATPVLAKYYLDARGSQLVTGWKMLAFLPLGEKMLVALGKAGRDWLWEKFGVEQEDGHCAVSDDVLARAQAEFGVPPLAGQPYATFWLNPPAEAEAATAPEAASPPDPLTSSQRRALREIAARSIHRHRLMDGWVLAHEAALADPDFVALWDLEFITRREVRDATVEVALTLSGRDHLKAQGHAPQDGLSRNSCATPWLRETPPEAQAATPDEPATLADEGEGGAGAALAPHRDQFASDIMAVTAESRAVSSLAAAARQAAALLNGLKGRTKAPKADEVDPLVRLLEAALEAVAPYLPQDAV